MLKYSENRVADATKRLDTALRVIEQAAQTIRWRLAHLSADLTIVEQEVAALCRQSGQVATIYGQFATLTSVATFPPISFGEAPSAMQAKGLGDHSGEGNQQ